MSRICQEDAHLSDLPVVLQPKHKGSGFRWYALCCSETQVSALASLFSSSVTFKAHANSRESVTV